MSQQRVKIASRGALHLADDLNVERGSCLAAKDASPNPPLHRKKALGEYLSKLGFSIRNSCKGA